jgi:hypothetical protein
MARNRNNFRSRGLGGLGDSAWSDEYDYDEAGRYPTPMSGAPNSDPAEELQWLAAYVQQHGAPNGLTPEEYLNGVAEVFRRDRGIGSTSQQDYPDSYTPQYGASSNVSQSGAALYAPNVAGVGAGIGSATGGFADSLFKVVQDNPLVFLVAGVGIALYLIHPGGESGRR